MKILFDSQIFRSQVYGGISRYIVELAQHLNTTDDCNARIFGLLHINEYLRFAPSDLKLCSTYIPQQKRGENIRIRLEQLLTMPVSGLFQPDIFHGTYYLRSQRPHGAKRFVITVHDMIHEHFPTDFSPTDRTSRLKRQAVIGADHVICVSENTRKDLIDLFNVPPEKISVVFHGAPQPLPVQNKIIATGRPYILFVGKRGGYKNFLGLLLAFASDIRLAKELQIIAFGGGQQTQEESELLTKLGLNTDQVQFISGDDDVLAALYRNARVFVYPSYYEGFGMPILEAMSYDCPVATSSVSSMPEVAGDAAYYFDPLNRDSIAEAITQVAFDDEYRQQIIEKGQDRSALFTWQKTAEDTLSVYQKTLQS